MAELEPIRGVEEMGAFPILERTHPSVGTDLDQVLKNILKIEAQIRHKRLVRMAKDND